MNFAEYLLENVKRSTAITEQQTNAKTENVQGKAVQAYQRMNEAEITSPKYTSGAFYDLIETVLNTLSENNIKIKDKIYTNFGVEIIFARAYSDEDISALLTGYNYVKRNKSIFVIN